jgi:hypothetical protein
LLEKKVMPPRKAAPVAKPSNPFAVFAESDTEDEVVVEVIEKKPENRFESLVKEGVSPLVPSVLPFTQQKGRWMKAKIDEGWISLRPRPEHEQAAIAAAAAATHSTEPVEAGHDQPRSAHEWAERVRQSLEKAEGTPRVERLKDIRDSLTRLSFFRRPIEHLVSKEETSSTTVHA